MGLVRSRMLAAGAFALALLIGSAGAAKAQGTQGTITGLVSAQGSNEALQEARVILVGTSLFTSTGQDGRYTMRNVPAGSHEVRVIRVGYQEQKKPVTVTAGQTTTLDFTLGQVVVRLTEVVTTATGETRAAELGNAIPRIDASNLTATAAVTNVSDLLTARATGVQVTGNSFTGGGAKIRIRGASSLNLANDPIYVIDGVRMTSTPGSNFFGTGGTAPSRVGDINPEEIEAIEVVKGPSAATLYGTDAANGVIVITTKKGRAGAPRWTFYGEAGLIQDRNEYPTNFTLFGTDTLGDHRECVLSEIANAACTQDSVKSLNVFATDYISPLKMGFRQQLGGQVSGGNESVRYFVSGEGETENGTMQLPDFERDRFNRQGIPIRDYVENPNTLKKISTRANLNAQLTSKLDASVSAGFIALDQRFPLEANSTAGIGSQAFGGKGYIDTTRVVSGVPERAPLYGYRAFTPGMVFQETINQRIGRFIGSSSWNYRPTSWLQGRADIGIDYTSRVDDDLRRRGEGAPLSSTSRLGAKGSAGANITNFTANLGSTASWSPRDWLNSKTTVGVQYVNFDQNLRRGSSTDLAPGTQTAGAGANQVASEATTLSKTLGLFVEEGIAIRDRLFLTGAVRSDQNSAFGSEFQSVLYPKLSMSWIISDESFFPEFGWLNQLRFRSAYGSSGRQPGPNDAIRFFGTQRANVSGTDVSAVVYSALGNTTLKPEKATEFEAGFEGRIFDNRVNVDFTYYNKLTKDALINLVQPGSLGAAANVVGNLGSTKNTGIELMVNSQLVNRPWLGLDATVSGSTNRNKLVSLGVGPTGQALPAQVGATTRAQAGFPLFGYWQRQYRFSDANNDGFITVDELDFFAEGDSSTFVGPSAPKYQAILTTGIETFSRRLRLQGLVDYKGGHKVLNGTERIRCQSRVNCIGTSDPNASLFEQARAVALREHPYQSQFGYMEDASFIRLREVSATYNTPERFAQRFLRARGASLTVAARNLGVLWTRYTGTDPETDANAGDSIDTPFEFQTVSPPSYLTFRLNLNF
jgi:TonB-linked SusC/RagA family outer membrane protein